MAPSSSFSTSAAPTTQPLLTLLPSYTANTLPQRLLSAATTLLSQSHRRAPHLKPDEEIARPYACAELAVDRLREPLRLPPKKTPGKRGNGGGPPCKPAVYKKLLAFLQGVLEKDLASAAGTPRSAKRKRDATAAAAGVDGGDDEEDVAEGDGLGGTPSRKRARSDEMETPTKTPSANTSARKDSGGFVGKLKKAQQGAGGRKGAAQDAEAPPLVMPSIRRLCKTYDTPAMAPHVYTGTCVVLKAAEMWPRPTEDDDEDAASAEDFDADVLALVTALYLMVLTKMGKGQMKTKVFNGVSNKAVEMFGAKGLTKESAISDWIRHINSEGWCKGHDWFESVPEDAFAFTLEAGDVAGEDGEAEGHDEDGDEQPGFDPRVVDIDLKKEDPAGVLLPGLGTMMQPSVEWTSDSRRRQFAQWKKGVMKRFEELGQGDKGAMAAPASRRALVH